MEIILLSVLAGVVGTGTGGFLAVLLGNGSEKTTCLLISFAGGVMTSIVCFGLIPHAIDLTNVSLPVIGLIIGVVVIMMFNKIVDKITDAAEDKLKLHHTHSELYHEERVIVNSKAMFRSGVIMLTAIGLHNLPEGMAIGSAGGHDAEMGMLLAFMIALHNIPEGMAIAAPLIAGGVSKWRVVLLTLLSGTPTFIGAILGLSIAGISDGAVALSLSIAGGAMLYVVFGEVIPQAVVMSKDRTPTIVTLVGIILGMILTVG